MPTLCRHDALQGWRKPVSGHMANGGEAIKARSDCTGGGPDPRQHVLANQLAGFHLKKVIRLLLNVKKQGFGMALGFGKSSIQIMKIPITI